MAILKLLLGGATPCRLRILALANVTAFSFVTSMTFMTSVMGYFAVVPSLFHDNHVMLQSHRCLILYLFVNVCGNFFLCLRVNTSTSASSSSPSPRRRTLSGERSVDASSAGTSSTRERNKEGDMDRERQTKEVSNSKYIHTTSKGDSKSNGTSSFQVDGVATDNQTSTSSSQIKTSTKVSSSSLPRHRKTRMPQSPRKLGRVGARARREPSADEPERSHECPLCDKQILRRDHHCFFMTVCIGYHNHKHFIFFCLYMMVGALYGVILAARYLSVHHQVRFYGPQTFVMLLVQIFQNMVYRKLVPAPFFSLMIFELYLCLLVGLTAAGFLYWHLAITWKGQTTFEAMAGDTSYCRNVSSNLRDVLGRYWPLLFILPLPLPQHGDGRCFSKAAIAADRAAARSRQGSDASPNTRKGASAKDRNSGDGNDKVASTTKGRNSGDAADENVVSAKGCNCGDAADERRDHSGVVDGGTTLPTGVRERRGGGGGGGGGGNGGTRTGRKT